MTKNIDENMMVIKPIVYARSKKKYNIGDIGSFNSNGWKIKAKVFSIRFWEDDRFISSDGYFVYEVSDYKKIRWIGLEMTEKEMIEFKKQEDKKRQMKLKL